MIYTDLRDWLTDVEGRGELLRMSDVSHDLEMGGIMELLDREGRQPVPAILFEDVPGYPSGYRTLFGILASPLRLAMSVGIPEDDLSRVSLVRNWYDKRRRMKYIPPKTVNRGKVQENILVGNDIDLLKFPIPRYHELDGGRYFGTSDLVIMRHPSEGWINVGTYRCMLVDKQRLALHISPGSQGRIILEEYFTRGQPAPVAIAVGVDPALLFAALNKIPWGVSEYDFAGGTRGEPVEVIKAPYTGLPVPAHAEIVVEGECQPGDNVDEGPFGEWHGYYANQGLEPVQEPAIQVKTIMHRHNPILSCVQVGRLRAENMLVLCMSLSATIWNALESCGVPGVTGVWAHEVGGGSLLNVVSLKTAYAGHSKQALIIASEIVQTAGNYTIVVDDDVDPSDLEEVMWAVVTRTDPERAIDILHYCRSNNADPTISLAEKRKSQHLFTNHALIDACRPYEWKHEYYPIARMSPELRAKLISKWKPILKDYFVD